MAARSGSIEQSEAVGAQLVSGGATGTIAPAHNARVRLGLAAACMFAAALLLGLTGNVDKVAHAFKADDVVGLAASNSTESNSTAPTSAPAPAPAPAPSEDAGGDQEDSAGAESEVTVSGLKKLIAENNDKIPEMQGQVKALMSKEEYGLAAAIAAKVQLYQDQNERYKEMQKLIEEAKKKLDAGIYWDADKLLKTAISNKCSGLTISKVTQLRIDFKDAVDEDDYDRAEEIIKELRPLEAKCGTFAEAMDAVEKEELAMLSKTSN